MRGRQQTTVVLALVVLLCSIALAEKPTTANAKTTENIHAENYTIDSGSPTIINKIINNLTITGGSPIIQNSTIHNRVVVRGGSSTFIGNVIEDGIHIDAKEGQITIANNTITSKSGFPNIYVQGIYANISGNIITGNNCQGISPLFTKSAQLR